MLWAIPDIASPCESHWGPNTTRPVRPGLLHENGEQNGETLPEKGSTKHDHHLEVCPEWQYPYCAKASSFRVTPKRYPR